MNATETDMMRSVCAWCDAELAPVPCSPVMVGRITHGICPECAAVRFFDLVPTPTLETVTFEKTEGAK